jgi:peptidoglycan/xylan/chitin deacetylase (PgdA/CDA1 family)
VLLVLIAAVALKRGGDGPAAQTAAGRADATDSAAAAATPKVLSATEVKAAGQRAREAAAVQRAVRRTPVVAVAGSQHREMALTFDDGPGPYTLEIVRILKERGVPATFFQVGQSAKTFTAGGHAELKDPTLVVANHSENHARMSGLPVGGQESQIADAQEVIKQAGNPSPRLFRPPYGAYNATTVKVLGRHHMLAVLWTIDSNDYERPGVATIVKRVLDGAKPGAIVLMHDAGGDRSQTVQALPIIITELRKRDYKLVTIPRLMLDNPPPLKQPAIAVGVG